MANPIFSLEFSPLKGDAFPKAIPLLLQLDPVFGTVTFGAGGSALEGTLETALRVQEETGLPMAVHVTCTGLTKPQTLELADRLWDQGIGRVVALFGDPREKSEGEHFASAAELTKALKGRHNFDVSVAVDPATPEGIEKAIAGFKQKIDAGADRGIMQVTFAPTLHAKFFEAYAKSGIHVPITPGVAPVLSVETLAFYEGNHVPVPDYVKADFTGLEKGPFAVKAVQLFKSQITALMQIGVPQIHLYTQNTYSTILRGLHAAGIELAPPLVAIANAPVRGISSVGAASLVGGAEIPERRFGHPIAGLIERARIPLCAM